MHRNPQLETQRSLRVRAIVLQLLISLDDAKASTDDLDHAFQSDNPCRALAAQTRLHQAWRGAANAIRVLEQISGCTEEDARRELGESYRRGRVLLVLAWNVISILPVKRHLESRFHMRQESMGLRGDSHRAITTLSDRLIRERHATMVSLDDVLRRARARLMKLTSAIRQCDYFGSWLAAFQLRAALRRVRDFIYSLPANRRATARIRLDGLESLACPMLELAPAPTRADVHALRAQSAYGEQSAWRELETRWRWSCCVLPIRFSAVDARSHGRSASEGDQTQGVRDGYND